MVEPARNAWRWPEEGGKSMLLVVMMMDGLGGQGGAWQIVTRERGTAMCP